MRKLALGTMACALTLALGLVGCGGAPNTPAEDAPATDEQTTVEEEPAFNAEDFFGCWEYSYDDYWFYVYGDGTYEWFYDDGTSVTGTYEISDDGTLSIDGSDLTFTLDGEGGMVDSDGDTLFQSELPDFDDTPTPEEGGGDHESSGRDYETLAGHAWMYGSEIYAFNIDGSIDIFDEDGTTIIGHGEFYWSDDVERGQVYVESSNFEEEIMYLYLDSYENLIFDEGDGGTAYVLQPTML